MSTITQTTQEINSELNNMSCSHENTVIEKGISICTDCGLELEEKETLDKDWRYYGGDGKYAPVDSGSAQQPRKAESHSIFKDVENFGFADTVVAEANKYYIEVTKNKISRGNARKSIIFACIFHAYKSNRMPQSYEKLIQIFGLTKKAGLKGLKHVNLNAPKESKIRDTYITPIDLVGEIMDKFQAGKEQKNEVIQIYEKIRNKSSRLNRSRPQSIASALVYYWIVATGKKINLKEFAQSVELSELTINKIVKEIEEILSLKK